MSKWLVLPLVALAYLAGSAIAATPRDRDHDRIPDRWEKRFHLSTLTSSARADVDKDRLRNLREFRLRTNPRKRDTDGDRLGDGAEVFRYKTNPRKKDTDGDGLSDRAEIKRWKTNPRKKDTDGDGVKDGFEVLGGSNPRNPASKPAPAAGSPGLRTPAPAPPAGPQPSPANTGVPAGWTPKQTRSSTLTVTQAGAVVEDVLLQNADLVIAAPNVTVRRVKLQGGSIANFSGPVCSSGAVIEDSTIEPPPGASMSTDGVEAVGAGGYTARRVKIWQRNEGFRSAGNGDCGPVRIESSFAKIVIPDGRCDMHSDGIQGYYSPPLTVVNTTIDFNDASCGTAPYFVPSGQGNTTADVDGLLVMGGGYPFRQGVPGSVRGVKIVDKSWGYGPVDVKCSALSHWDASVVTIDSNYQVTKTIRSAACGGSGS